MKKAVKIIVNILAWIVLALALIITIIVFSSGRNNGVANLFGYIPMTVESDSMQPTFSKGDLIICHEIDDIMSLKEDDVITFWTIIDGKRVKNTHRIVGINDAETTRSFITRGDNNSLDDAMPAYAGDLIGKWTDVKLSGVGNFMNFLRTKTGFFVCILIPMAIFFLFELYKFIIVLVELKRPEPVEQLDEEEIKRRAVEEYLASQKQNSSAPEEKTEEAKAETQPAAEIAEEAKEEAQPTPESTEEAKEETQSTPEIAEEAKEETQSTPESAEEVKEEAKPTSESAEEAKTTSESTEEAKEESAPAPEENNTETENDAETETIEDDDSQEETETVTVTSSVRPEEAAGSSGT